MFKSTDDTSHILHPSQQLFNAALDHASAYNDISVVQNNRLSSCDGSLRFVKAYMKNSVLCLPCHSILLRMTVTRNSGLQVLHRFLFSDSQRDQNSLSLLSVLYVKSILDCCLKYNLISFRRDLSRHAVSGCCRDTQAATSLAKCIVNDSLMSARGHFRSCLRNLQVWIYVLCTAR